MLVMDYDAGRDAPDAAELLRALADEVEGDIGQVAQIQIQAGTMYQYACRLYPAEGGDFEGKILKFDEGG